MDIEWICEICGEKFKSGIKEFIKFETKPEINCIKYVEDTKRRLVTNSNYDMTIDYLLIRIWEDCN